MNSRRTAIHSDAHCRPPHGTTGGASPRLYDDHAGGRRLLESERTGLRTNRIAYLIAGLLFHSAFALSGLFVDDRASDRVRGCSSAPRTAFEA